MKPGLSPFPAIVTNQDLYMFRIRDPKKKNLQTCHNCHPPGGFPLTWHGESTDPPIRVPSVMSHHILLMATRNPVNSPSWGWKFIPLFTTGFKNIQKVVVGFLTSGFRITINGMSHPLVAKELKFGEVSVFLHLRGWSWFRFCWALLARVGKTDHPWSSDHPWEMFWRFTFVLRLKPWEILRKYPNNTML